MEIIRVAGFDPGLRFSGYGIVTFNCETNEFSTEHCGVIKNKSSTVLKGLDAIMHMRDLIQEVSQAEPLKTVDATVVEVPAAIYNKKFSSGGLIPPSVVAGIALMSFAETEVIPVYPTVWNSRKKKEQTAKIVQGFLGESETWNYDYCPKAKSQMEHIIDAMGMALWYMRLQYLD